MVRVRGAVGLGVVLAGVLLAWCPFVFALDPALDVSQYAHMAWRIRDGFFKGEIRSIAQTPDGYLWLGTAFGLYRFDGVRAVSWQPAGGEQLPDNFINGLLVARDGALWISTHKGLASWKEGKLTQYPEVAGQVLEALLEDREGTVWVGMRLPGSLCAVRAGKVQCYGAGSFGRAVFALYEDHKGNLWVTAQTGLWRWKPGRPERYTFPRGVVEADALIEDGNSELLLATNVGLKQLKGGRVQSYVQPGVTGQFWPNRFLRSSDASLWVGTHQGLLHFHQGRKDLFGIADGLSGDFLNCIFEDREGNVWVGTTYGLDRFREYAFPRISTNQGLLNSSTWSVQATTDGSIWIGAADGLNRWASGHLTVYGSGKLSHHISPQDERELALSGIVSKAAYSGLSGEPQSLGLDDQGRMWVSTSNGAFYFEGGRFIRVPGVPGGLNLGIAADGHGKTWISNQRVGLLYVAPGNGVQHIPWSRFGQKDFWPRALLPDRLQGGVWLGFYQGGIFYFKDGQVRASYKESDGLGNGRVNHLRFGSRGTLWAATEGGLSRIKDGRVVTLTTKNGLPCDEVHWSMEDDDHSVWLYMPCGLVRVARSELDAWVSDPKRIVQTTIFDASDGVKNVGNYANFGNFGPHVTKTPDGKIWFVPDGVSVIDPHHLPFNKVPPPVHIEQITADRRTYDVPSADSGRFPLPALIRDLEIDYTALSLVAPEKVHFRFKLEGQDEEWREIVNARQVQYSNLRPGSYRFRVTACNNSGVWNEGGTFLDFTVAPAYYQTMWFRGLCVAAVLALVWTLYQLRLQQLKRQYDVGLEARVGERTRIARELHDTLLQSFQGLLMRFQAVSNELVEGEPKRELDDAIDRAARAITEGRDAVQGLRSSVLEGNDLAAALGTLGKELAVVDSRAPEFTMQVEGAPRSLHPILRDEVYRVAGEALRNAFRHADARRIEVEIRYDEREFRLRVRDDGKGIDPKLLVDSGRAGHFGLRGMRERAKRVGGKLTVWSSDPRTDGGLESGTEVELRIPASRAYTRVRPPRRRWLAEKFSSKGREMDS